MNVPENSAFRTSEIGSEAMSRGTGTVCGIALSRAALSSAAFSRAAFSRAAARVARRTALTALTSLTALTQSSDSPTASPRCSSIHFRFISKTAIDRLPARNEEYSGFGTTAFGDVM